MVSSGTVMNDWNSTNTALTNYRSNIDSVSGSWKGPSYDNLSSKADGFLGEYRGAIEKQMSAFASACDAYEQYINEKNAYNTALSNYNSAVANNASNAGSYLAEANQHKANMEKLKTEIESLLQQASSPSLSAAAIGAQESAAAAAQAGAQTVSYSSSAMINNVLQKAVEIADDNSHGYSQQRRWGNPDYDCSSFVITCWESAGTGVKEAGATYTGNMKNAFLKTGLFEWIPGNPSVEDLRPGDILLNPGSHTELYYGDGKMIGARHGDRDGRGGDSSGQEICITKLSRKWTGVLRYTGGNNNNTTTNV